MAYLLVEMEKFDEPQGVANDVTHGVTVIKEIDAKTYAEIAKLNSNIFEFEKKKDAARILLSKSKILIEITKQAATNSETGKRVESRSVEIKMIEVLIDLSNGFHSFWRTSEADIKRSFGRMSPELKMFYEVRQIGIPYCGILFAVRNLANHRSLPKMKVRNDASLESGIDFDIFLDISYLRAESKRHQTIIDELDCLDEWVSMMSFFDFWPSICQDLANSVLKIQAREFEINSAKLAEIFRNLGIASRKGLCIFEVDKEELRNPSAEKEIIQTILHTEVMREINR